MKTILRVLVSLLSIVLAFPAPVLADDTEIFTVPPIVSGVKPNILIVLDNSANWSASFGSGTKFSSEIATLSSVIGGLSADFNVGLMMAGETGSGNSSPVSAYVRFAVRNTTAANRAALQSLFLNMDINADKTNNAPYGFGLYEVFKYFGGGGATLTPQDSQHFGATAYGGFGQRKRDFAGNAVANTAGAIPGNAFASASSSSYVSPITDSCQRTYVVVISNGLPQSGADSGNPNASALLRNVGGANAITTIPLSSSTAQGNIGDEYARFLYQTDVSGLTGKQNIVTYTINVYDADRVTGNDNANIALLRSMASQGHGRYFAATSTAALEDALKAIFNEVQSVNTVFASVTLPVSVNVRGTNLNQVYMGMFRATSDGAPRWLGNLKEFQLGVAGGSVFLADQSGRPAESPVTGFIIDNAVSFWTSASSFWSFLPSGNPPSASDSPDGPVVEKGGVAQRIRSLYPNPDSVAAQTRKIFTCTDSCLATPNASLATYPFNTVTIDPSSPSNIAAFGASGSTEVASIINWVRGQDNEADENVDGSLSGVRASVHGDVLHSRPAVVNYNRSDGNNDVVVYYGANDGLFRAVKGGQNSSDGFEKWAFVPKEFYGRIKRLRDNSPAITAANPKHYFADGSVGLYQQDANNDGRLVATDGDKVHLFMAMRRGGRMIYALDVSDPDIPKFMWQRDNNSPGYGELGQSWSEPKARKIRASANPVLIFGAGYDPAVEDLDPVPSGVTNTMGRGIFVVDAITGDVLWQAGPATPATPSPGQVFRLVPGMTYAIPSDVAILDRNGDGFADRLYVGDTGGNVWRVDLNDPSPANWTVNKLGSVGFAQYGTVDSRRKFLYAPDVVFGSDANGAFDTVLIGSGDREHPFNGIGDTAHPLANAVVNRFYMFKDRSTGLTFSGTTITEADLFDTTNNLIQQGSASQIASAITTLTAAKGWFITLGTGEKVVSGVVTLGSATFFNTNQPSPRAPGVCGSNLGIARNYAVNFLNGAAIIPYDAAAGLTAASRFMVQVGGGYAPTPVPVIVDIGGTLYQVVIAGTTVLRPPASPLQARIRTFWHQR